MNRYQHINQEKGDFMRVITPHGLGWLSDRYFGEAMIEIKLDEAFLGQKIMRLNGASEVFILSDWAIARVLNISGSGYFSNLQFHRDKEGAFEKLLSPTPPDETIFILDLSSGTFQINRELGILAQEAEAMSINPWIDRWALERTELYENAPDGISDFAQKRKDLAGACGISSSILLDLKKYKIIWFYITVNPPLGVVFEKKYI